MVALNDVAKSFRVAPGPGRRAGSVTALRAVTASLRAGGVTGVVGPNGAGKSTLFGLLLGFLEPTAGDITIDGADPRTYVHRHGASYLPERFQLPRDWTIGAGLRALLALDGSAHKLDEILQRFELAQFAGAAVHTLSRGTLQRVGVAQAVAVPRRLMVFDEPTEGLDPLWRVRFREQIGELRSSDRLILIASHDLSELERTADRVLILHQGTITETVELQSEEGQPREYTLVLTEPHASVTNIFTNSVIVTGATYSVTVSGATDLSARLAALLDAGATIVSVNPAAALEPRVTRNARPELK